MWRSSCNSSSVQNALQTCQMEAPGNCKNLSMSSSGGQHSRKGCRVPRANFIRPTLAKTNERIDFSDTKTIQKLHRSQDEHNPASPKRDAPDRESDKVPNQIFGTPSSARGPSTKTACGPPLCGHSHKFAVSACLRGRDAQKTSWP